jgi:hypothetical protein
MRAAQVRSSSGSWSSAVVPSTRTYAYGGESSSTHSDTRPSRRSDLALDALAPGREEQRAVIVHVEPDGHHHRAAVETRDAELARAHPERQEGADLRLVHPSHVAPPG